MVQIQKRFEDNELNISGGSFYVGEGWRQTMITNIELVNSYTDGKPQDLLISGVVIEGEFKHTDVDMRLSVNDENLTPSGKISWAKMAHISLKAISVAAGLPSIPYANMDVLKGKKINVKYVIKKGNQKKDEYENPVYGVDGQPELYPDSSQARDFKAIPQASSQQTMQPAAPSPQPVAQPIQPQAPQQPMPANVESDEIPF